MGQGMKFVTLTMPKTGWHEPARQKDDLLRLPKGRPLAPTDEVHEYTPTDRAASARLVEKTASIGKTPPSTAIEMSRTESFEASKEEGGGEASSEVSSQAEVVDLDGSKEIPEDYDGDVDDDSIDPGEADDSSSILSDRDATIADDDSDDLPLLDEIDETEDGNDISDRGPAEYEPTLTPSIPPSNTSTGPRPVQASKHRSKALRQGTESIHPHPTDPTKVIIIYQVTGPTGQLFRQDTEIPKVMSAPTNPPSASSSVLFPDIQASKIPRTSKKSPWTPVPGTSDYEWTRVKGRRKETWRVNVFFRRLDRDTYTFQDIYVNIKLLQNVNPNDKAFHTAYNKWILQIARRRDATYTSEVNRIHWTTAERRALYTGINTFCAKFGIHNFGFAEECKLNTEQLQIIADAANATPNPSRSEPRGVDAIRGQIASAHNKSQPKNKQIFDLLAKGAKLRARMSGGEEVADVELMPENAIPLSEFPMDSPPLTTPHLSSGGRKRRRSATVEDTESCSSGLSSPTTSEAGGVRGHARVAAGGNFQLGESEEGNWLDAREVSPSPLKKARRA